MSESPTQRAIELRGHLRSALDGMLAVWPGFSEEGRSREQSHFVKQKKRVYPFGIHPFSSGNFSGAHIEALIFGQENALLCIRDVASGEAGFLQTQRAGDLHLGNPRAADEQEFARLVS